MPADERPLTLEEKRARLAQALQRKALQPIEAPVSFSQQRLWFVDQLDPGSPLYNIMLTIRVTGALREDVLQRVVDTIVMRHESLRTTFGTRGGEPLQRIAPRASVVIERVELDQLAGENTDDKVARFARAQVHTRFDLSRGPLFRFALLSVGPEEHYACFTTHHIVSDGWSVGVVLFELAALYKQLTGQPSRPLPELRFQYRDYARWQRERLQGAELDRLLTFWKAHLDGAPHTVELPTDRPRPSKVTYNGTIHRFRFSAVLLASLKDLSRQEGATLFTTMLAGFAALLYRYSGQEDMLIGVPITGRERAEIQPLVGYFVNLVVARVQLAGDPSFRELLGHVRKSTLDAYAHQEIPFEKLVEALQPKRLLDRNPLVQVVYLHQSFPLPSQDESPGLHVEPLEIHPGFSRFELGLRTEPDDHGVACIFEYSTDLFDADTIQRLAGHFQMLLESVVTNPDLRLSVIPILTDAERQRLLGSARDRQVDFLPAGTVHQAFEAQAAATPDAVALVCGDVAVSYGDLNAWANRVAHRLRTLEVAAEDCVGLYLAPSIPRVVAELAALKAGCACVLLDVHDPAERTRMLLDAAAVRILLVDRQDAGAAEGPEALGQPGLRVVAVDDLRAAAAEDEREDLQNPASRTDPHHRAYVIYTSGPAGRPMGVPLEHRHALQHVYAMRDRFLAEAGTSYALLQPWTADTSIAAILLPLLTGGRLHVFPDQGRGDARELGELLQRERIDVLQTTPAQLSVLLGAEGLSDTLPRRCLLLSGEPLRRDLVPRLRRVAPMLTVFYLDGYAETAGSALAFEIPPGDAHGGTQPAAGLPLGQPLGSRCVYVLDRHLQPVPIGVPGEMYLGGACLAQGYLNQPEVTRRYFLPDPFRSAAGARVYKTGVRARVLRDGSLEHLGRMDDLVQRGGFRVAAAEVQRALADHPRVAQCAVVPMAVAAEATAAEGDKPGNLPRDSDGSADRRLVAYVVPRTSVAPTSQELETFLQGKLPAYMLPSAFILLEQLPTAADGALERAALPSPRRLRPATVADRVPPRTDTEQALAVLWRQVLGTEEIGVHDDFFEIGGNSLLAMQLVAALRQRWATDVPLRALFEEPTIANAARLIDASGGAAMLGRPPTIPPAPRGARLPLSSSQQVLHLLEQFQQGVPFNASFGFRLHGPLDRDVLARSLAALVERHEILRASIRIIDGQPAHVLNPPGPLPLVFRDLRDLPPEAREPEAVRLGEEMTRTRFDLAAGYLVRFLLAQLRDAEHLLLVAVHHLVSDGWSFPILLRDLVQFYAAFAEGKPPALPELPIQFADYAYWQRHRDRATAKSEAAFWRERFRGPLPVLALPLDFARTKSMHVQPDVCELDVPEETSRALREFGRQEGATLYMTLLAAYAVLLRRYSDQTDVIVGSATANRLLPETHDLIGFLASFLPLRCDLSGDPTFQELLGRVRATCAAAFSRPEPDLEELAPLLRPPGPGTMPVCQTLFTFGEFPEQPLSSGALTWTPFNLNVVRFSGFDLVLAMRHNADALAGAFLYRSDLFRAETVTGLRESFLTLLRGIVANPATRLSRLPVLAEAQRARLLVEWNDTVASFPQDLCVHELFEAQCARTPGATAVIAEGQAVTYRQLNRRANVLGRRLQQLGVGKETLVAVLVERGPDLVAALLAVWKAGGAYLPLDPAWPLQRMTAVLRDAGVAVLLAHRKLADGLAAGQADANGVRHTVCVDAPEIAAARESPEGDTNLPRRAEPASLAYVIYTSGSTGPPKGVMVEHRSVVNVVTSFARTYGLNSQDRVLQQASVAFDVSVNEIFPILSAGGGLVIPRPDEAADFDRLAALVADQRITILGATPSGLTELNRRAERLQTVRLVLSGGEALARSHVDRLVKSALVTNGYGPTETTVCATFYDLRQLHWPEVTTIPIGKPLPNYRVYVLDEQLEPVPIGCAGELCIAGAGLARGYRGDPDLTARKFVSNPFTPGERLYRTGDEGRWRPDGNLEFLGRLDRQVKIRGFRVELGEVEAALGQHAGVAQAVAVCDRDAAGNGRVVAYVVPRTPSEPRAASVPDLVDPDTLRSDLRRFLLQKLPEHMVPAVFMVLAEIPLTANQKVDYAALPKPQATRPELDVPYVAPRNADEETLAGIWREALGLDRVGIHDNFFLIGGHSLLAAEVMYRVQQAFDLAFPYRLFFQGPTVAQMAERFEALRRQDGDSLQAAETEAAPLVLLFGGGDAAPLYCIHAFGGQVHEFARLAQALGPVCPVYGIQSRAVLDYRKEAPSWQAMAEDYAQVIQGHQPQGPYRLCGHSAGGVLGFAIAQALEAAGAEVSLLCLIDSYWNLDEVSVERGAEQELVAALRASLGQFLPHLPADWEALLADTDRLHDEFFALPHEARIEKLHAWLAALPYFPADLSEQLQNQLRLYERHRSLFNAYTLPRVAAPLCVAWAEDTLPGTKPLPRFDWAQRTSGPVEVLTLPANHFTILAPPTVTALAAWLAERIERSRGVSLAQPAACVQQDVTTGAAESRTPRHEAQDERT